MRPLIFSQADIQVDGVMSTQGYNRYSYVHNNPLSGVDPSGYGHLSDSLDRVSLGRHIFRAVGPENASIIHSIGVASCNWLAAVCAGVGGWNYADTFGASGDEAIRAGVIGAVSAYAFSSVAKGIGGAEWAQASSGGVEAGTAGALNAGGFAALVLAQGAVGGVMSVVQGGKFGHGFASAGFSKLASPFLPSAGPGIGDIDIGQVIASAVIGGTASQLSGGKFANGAITGAFVNLFNQQKALAQKDYKQKALDGFNSWVDDNADSLGDLADNFRKYGNDYISSMDLSTDQTHALVYELSAAAGVGLVGGGMIAIDRNGMSHIRFAGIQGGLAVGASGTIGRLIYDGPRSGLVGWGGSINVSAQFYGGAEYEYIMSGGSTGHYIGPAGGMGASYAAELVYGRETWSRSF